MKRCAIALLSLFLVLPVLFSLAAAQENPSATGVSLGNQAAGMFSTKHGVNTHMFTPLMSDTPMTTLDGSTSFNARLVCSGPTKFMEIFVQPSPSGDLVNIIVTQDLDLNGSMDYTYAVPFPVSGVCGNGVISCTPGTWSNCQAFKWTSDETGKASLAVTAFTNLGGCYCINSSCGSNLVWNNLPVVLRSLGGGAVGGIQTGNSRMAISDVQVEGTLARYFGQNTRNCSTVTASDSNVEQYYYAPAAVESNVTAAVAAQSSDPSSLYSLMYNAYQNTPQSEVRTCSITRSAMPKWNEQYECYSEETVNDHCQALDDDPECQLRDESVDGVVVFRNFAGTGLVPQPSCITLTDTMSGSCEYTCPVNPVIPCTGDPPVWTDGESTYDCQTFNPVASYWGGWSGNLYLRGEGNRLLFGYAYPEDVCPLGDFPCLYDESSGRLYCDNGSYSEWCRTEDKFTESGGIEYLPGIEVWGSASISYWRQFSALGDGPGVDPQGKAYDSAMHLYLTYAGGSYAGTIYYRGIKVLAQDNTGWGYAGTVAVTSLGAWDLSQSYVVFHGVGYGSGVVRYSPYVCPIPGGSGCMGNPGYCNKTCEIEVCRDWWRKDRTYLCRAQGVEFSEIRQRSKTIKESAAMSSSDLYYRDYVDGAYSDHTLSASGTYSASTDVCAMACKTKKLIRNTETTLVSNRTQYVTNPEGYEFFYKSCVNGVCPLDEGESVVKDCQCINEFSEASVVMQALRMGGSDFICSSGTKRPLQ